MAKVAAIATLVIMGIIVADVIIHPAGTKAAATGISTITKPAYNALLGSTS
ncbi:MAG: hypothetical protein ACRDX8_12085 [Acidimicrobiales bacterium]